MTISTFIVLMNHFYALTVLTPLISDWHHYGHQIRRTVWQETKLPVGVGFGPTPTLAKAANHAAKKLSGFNGVAVIDDESARKHVLGMMDVSDVWGVGKRIAKKLKLMNIHSALDFGATRTSAHKKAM